MVPNLLLQPLVENAVKHGVRVLLGQGHIHVGAQREGDWLVMHVRDNGPGMSDPSKRNYRWIGTEDHACPPGAALRQPPDLQYSESPAGGAEIYIRIPFRPLLRQEATPIMIRALIVDDESLAREALREILEEDPSLQLLKDCKNGKEASPPSFATSRTSYSSMSACRCWMDSGSSKRLASRICR